jgi:hypothetical protein
MFVAELHDIVKLLDRATLNAELKRLGLGTLRGQSFSGLQWDSQSLPEPATDTWKAIIKHEGDDDWKDLTRIGPNATLEDLEFRRQRFLVTLADRFSSSIARQPRPDVQEFRGVKKLWGTENQDRTIKDFAGLRDMMAFVSGDPSWDQFVERYGDVVRSVPEDRRAPFTSLYNHLRLTGKVTRVLARQVSLTEANGNWTANLLGLGANTVDEAHGSAKSKTKGRWKFKLVKLYVEFPHHVVRLQDLNILGERRDAIKALAQTYPDHVLYSTEDFALLFFPEWEWDILRGLEGFQSRVRLIESDLAIMSSNLDTMGKFTSTEARDHGAQVRELRWPFDAPDVITGTLCCVCQQKAATQRWTKSGIEEWLCQKCFERRQAASPAEEYAKWDDLGADVAWIKLALWPDLMREVVAGLFAQAVGNDPETLNDFRSLPLEMDFLDDFSKVCAEWHTRLCEKVAGEQLIEPVSDYAELQILRLDVPDLWLHAAAAFHDALASNMPKLVEASYVDSPVQLFIDISSTKFPFHEHWRYFSRPRKAINVRNVVKGIELSLSVEEFRQVLGVAQSAANRRPLHELSTLWEATGSRAAVLLSAWERRLTLEQKLRSLGHNVLDLVQLARLVSS